MAHDRSPGDLTGQTRPGGRSERPMKRQLTAMLAAMLLVGLIGVGTTTATHVTPVELTAGNYPCPAGSTAIEPVVSGTYALVGGGSIQITVISSSSGPV